MEGFCGLRNVRNYPSAQFGQVTPTASSGSGSDSSTEPTTLSNGGGTLGSVRMSLWAALFASALLF